MGEKLKCERPTYTYTMDSLGRRDPEGELKPCGICLPCVTTALFTAQERADAERALADLLAKLMPKPVIGEDHDLLSFGPNCAVDVREHITGRIVEGQFNAWLTMVRMALAAYDAARKEGIHNKEWMHAAERGANRTLRAIAEKERDEARKFTRVHEAALTKMAGDLNAAERERDEARAKADRLAKHLVYVAEIARRLGPGVSEVHREEALALLDGTLKEAEKEYRAYDAARKEIL